MVGIPLVLLLLVAEGKPAPKFPLGKETTYVSGPLDDQGYIHYQAALNDRLGKGIVAEKNANALLWKAFGPRPDDTEMPAEFFQRLGIAKPPERGDYFIGLNEFLKRHVKLDPSEFELVKDQQLQATRRPWAAKDYPHIAAWLKVNEKPLAVVVEAAKRPDYFNPVVSPRLDSDWLGGALMPNVQQCRELGKALTARALMLVAAGVFMIEPHLGSGSSLSASRRRLISASIASCSCGVNSFHFKSNRSR